MGCCRKGVGMILYEGGTRNKAGDDGATVDEQYSSDDEKDDISEDDIVPAVPDVPTIPAIPAPYWDDVIVISIDEEPEMPVKKVRVKSRKRVFALVGESDSE
nr:hypothetical protein [Tanacetum cinerariifolium]